MKRDHDMRPEVLRGIAVLLQMLSVHGWTDADLSALLSEHRNELRNLAKYALDAVAEET